MITWIEAAGAAERLARICIRGFRGTDMHVLRDIYNNGLPVLMRTIVYEMTVNRQEIDAYLTTNYMPMAKLEFVADRELLLDACRQLETNGKLP